MSGCYTFARSALPERVLDALRGKPMTAKELSPIVHATINPTRSALRYLRAVGRIYIKGWSPTATRSDRIYALGNLPDAPAIPRSESLKRYKSQPHVRDRQNAAKRARRERDAALKTYRQGGTWYAQAMNTTQGERA